MRLESQMLPMIYPVLPSTLGFAGSGILVVPEPVIGSVIPDVLIGRWTGTPSREITSLTYVEAAVFALLETTPEMSESQILSQIFLARPTATRVMSKLLKLGAIERTESGALRVTGTMSTRNVEIIALEFKMRRWKEALDQASGYRTFADRAYVVLDGNQVTLTNAVCSEFCHAGVGLLLQYGSRY